MIKNGGERLQQQPHDRENPISQHRGCVANTRNGGKVLDFRGDL
jgi:hypothetical protein